jgi:hypothetical protein
MRKRDSIVRRRFATKKQNTIEHENNMTSSSVTDQIISK